MSLYGTALFATRVCKNMDCTDLEIQSENTGNNEHTKQYSIIQKVYAQNREEDQSKFEFDN